RELSGCPSAVAQRKAGARQWNKPKEVVAGVESAMPAPPRKPRGSSCGSVASPGGRWRDFGGCQLDKPKEVLPRIGSAASLPTRKPGGSSSGSILSQATQ